MQYFKKSWDLIDNYIIARLQNRPSTALFWYLPEPPYCQSNNDLISYQTNTTPPYLLDYRAKLKYTLTNEENIIVLPYQGSIGKQINPEAAFQFALGLHQQFYLTQDKRYLEQFWQYCHYFLAKQSKEGLWHYQFDWYDCKAPWASALAQSRGVSVMLRAFLLSQETKWLTAAKLALSKFMV